VTRPTFQSMLNERQPVGVIWLALGSVAVVEIAAHFKPAAIVIDMQHGLWDRHSLEAAIGVARASTQVIVRCADNTASAISTVLDAGANSVLIPLIESADAARHAVSFSRYPPEGIRSAGGVRALLRGVEGFAGANREVTVGVMIETIEGVREAEAIAAVGGIDYLFIGTGDLAMSRGATNGDDIKDDCAHVRDVATRHKLPCGIFTLGASDALRELVHGYDMAVIANDIDIVKTGVAGAQALLEQGLAARLMSQ
jgi:2-keto-3-deoxy-L-rhamnonate aldolase RhmA